MIRRLLPLGLTLLALGLAFPLSQVFASSGSTEPETEPKAKSERVIVLGMDGMDAEMAGDWIDAGELPNFKRLRDGGTFAPLMPANPAQSPVSWATLNTGVNPGKHGIFDFVGITRGSKSMPVAPGVGFQRQTKIPAADLDLPFADSNQAFMVMGGGVVLGLILLFVLGRFSKPIGLLGGLGVAGASVWYGLSWMGAYPEGGFPDWESNNLATNYWEELDNAGVPFRGQGTIVAYPSLELKNGSIIAGLGSPDAKAGLNSSAIYTTTSERQGRRRNYNALPANTLETADDMKAPTGKGAGATRIYELEKGEGSTYTSFLMGPRNLTMQEAVTAERDKLSQNSSGGDTERLKELNQLLGNRGLLDTAVPMNVTWNKGTSVDLSIDGTSQTVALNTWSEFYQVEFQWNQRLSTWALVRIWAEERDGELELFVSPLQIDPQHPTPGSRMCWPPDFAADLESRIGRFETLGWACQTHAVKDAELSDDAFLADIEFTLQWRTKMLEDALAADDWKVLFHFFGTPDRICHMLMRHMDPKHPQYIEAEANRMVKAFGREFALKDSGLVIYQEMDKIVGRMLDEILADGDVLMIVSDHGFDSFRRQVDLNAWLAHEGFLTLANKSALGVPKPKSKVKSSALRFIDWRETQAYSVAIGKIYLNLQGREAKGTVSADERDQVLKNLEDRLYAMTDPDSGEKVVKKVYIREDLYSGPYVAKNEDGEGAAEITIDFHEGYRASWGVTGGGINLVDGEDENGDTIAMPGNVIFDNDYAWSGDHCGVDIHEVQGIFFSNKQLSLPAGDEHYDACHLAPTVLDLQGVKVPQNYDRAPLQLQ